MYLYLILSNMVLEIITGVNWNANDTISIGEMISTCHCIRPINIMWYNIGLFLENIALENIMGGVSTANVMISSGNFWPKCLCTRPFDAIEVCFYQILANMMLEIITGGNSNANDGKYTNGRFPGISSANWNPNVTTYYPFTSCPMVFILFWKI